MGFYVNFPTENETLKEVIENHQKGGYTTIHEARQDIFIHEDEGVTFEVLDQTGKMHGIFITTKTGTNPLVTIDDLSAKYNSLIKLSKELESENLKLSIENQQLKTLLKEQFGTVPTRKNNRK